MLGRIFRRNPGAVTSAVGFFRAVALGTILAFVASLFGLVEPIKCLLLKTWSRLPSHAFEQMSVLLLSLFLLALLARLPWRFWCSLRLGLIPFSWIWAPSVAICWLAYETHHARLASASITAAVVVTGAAQLIVRGSAADVGPDVSGFLEPDLPVPEGGEDLLGRRELVESLVSTILLETPSIIAVTGGYGDGKTSFLNLTIGELNKSEEIKTPIIVRFSPWLAGDSNSLVLSLLNSIVSEVKRKLIVPGLSGDATRYARTLLSVVPWTERLKDLVTEPSQEKRIDALVGRIARVRRRVLIVMDDLDRMEAKELETVLKLLRGSDKLSNITFLCALDKDEVAKILQATRPHQDTTTFVEKFFPAALPLPTIDRAQLRDLFLQRMVRILERDAPGHVDLSKGLEQVWEDGGGTYLRNLRRIKLFLNRVNRSLQRIASEVNVEDFIRLELVRDIAPTLYDKIYSDRFWFWNRDFAFEAGFEGPNPIDTEKAQKQREEFYDKLKVSVPEETQYVFRLLEDLFPHFAEYRKKFTAKHIDPVEAEGKRRIFHPRCFPQYFTLKTPSELFPQRAFDAFFSSVRNSREDEAAAAFSRTFRSIVSEDFKRWHFMHLVENRFEDFGLQAQRGLCRGMAQNSKLWQADAFELMIAVRSTRETFSRIAEGEERRDLLRAIARESESDFYTLMLVRRLEDELQKDPSMLADGEQWKALGFPPEKTETNRERLADLQEIKGYIKERLREHYLIPDAPSVFEQYCFDTQGSPVNRIEPNLFLFNWQYLGSDAQSDQRQYLLSLFNRRPDQINQFLKLLFRVDFIDDYTQLKPLIDYKELSELITHNENILDKEKVRQFRERYRVDIEGGGNV